MNRLPDERDMEQVVRSWMRDDDEHPSDRNRQVGRIMGRVDETRQRHGAWRLFPFWRRARHIDDGDEELFMAGGGATAMRRGVSSAMGLAAVAVLIIVVVALVASLPDPMTRPGAAASPSPQPTIHPDDVALQAKFASTWSGERTSYADVLAVYAPDAVHTAHWLDAVERFVGPYEIWERIRVSGTVEGTDWMRLLDAGTGQHRYLGVADDVGGIACVIWVEDALITRHDCILPMNLFGSAMPAFVAPADDALDVWQEIEGDLAAGWGSADRELIERVVSPDIIHHVAYDNAETTLKGMDEYMSVMGWGEPQELAPPVALPAPAGEYRWTNFSGVAFGSLCTFWQRDGLIVRHDCIVPTFTYVPTEDETS